MVHSGFFNSQLWTERAGSTAEPMWPIHKSVSDTLPLIIINDDDDDDYDDDDDDAIFIKERESNRTDDCFLWEANSADTDI